MNYNFIVSKKNKIVLITPPKTGTYSIPYQINLYLLTKLNTQYII